MLDTECDRCGYETLSGRGKCLLCEARDQLVNYTDPTPLSALTDEQWFLQENWSRFEGEDGVPYLAVNCFANQISLGLEVIYDKDAEMVSVSRAIEGGYSIMEYPEITSLGQLRHLVAAIEGEGTT